MLLSFLLMVVLRLYEKVDSESTDVIVFNVALYDLMLMMLLVWMLTFMMLMLLFLMITLLMTLRYRCCRHPE